MPLTDEWFAQQRREFEELKKRYGIKTKHYYDTIYRNGELVLYQETKDSPVMVKHNGTWVEWTETASRKTKTRKPRGAVTDQVKEVVVKRLNKGDKPSQIARDVGLSAATISKIKKEAADAGKLNENPDNHRTKNVKRATTKRDGVRGGPHNKPVKRRKG